MLKTVRILLRLPMLIIVGSVVGCDNPEQRAEEYLEKGHVQYQKGDYERAALELRNALQLNDKLAEAWYLLGRIALSDEKWRTAVAQFDRTLELDAEHVDAIVYRGSVLLLAGDLEAVSQAVDDALALSPDHANAILLRAALETRRGDFEAAEASVEKAIAVEPTNEEAYSTLSVGYVRDERLADAEKILLDGLEQIPDSVRLRVLLANLYRRQQRQDDEIRMLRDVVARSPDNAELVYRLARALANYQKLDEAEIVLREHIAQVPEETRGRLLLVKLLREYRSAEAAEQELKAQISALAESEELELVLAGRYEQQQRRDEAKAVYRGLIERRGTAPSALEARLKLADILASEGDNEESLRLITEVLTESPHEGDALVARAELRLQDKNYDGAIADLRLVVVDRPNSREAADLLVGAYLAKGDSALALDQLERYVSENPADELMALQLAALYAQLGQIDDAERHLKKAADRGGDEGAALEALVELYLRDGRVRLAIEAAERMRGEFPENPVAAYLLGLARQAAGEHEHAVAAFETALQLKPNAVQTVTALVRSRLALAQGAAALKTLAESIENDQDNPQFHNLRGWVLSSQGEMQQALAAFEQASRLRPNWEVPYLNRSNVLLGQARRADAVAVLHTGIEATNGDSKLLLQLATMVEAEGDEAGAAELYRRTLVEDREHEAANNNLALLLVKDSREAGALHEALEMVRRFEESPNPLFRDTLGWILFLSGRTEEAIPHLEFAVDGAPQRPDVRYHLAMAYQEASRLADARLQLEQAIASNKPFPERDLAQLALQKL